jgi:hypothetical protein
MAKTYGGYPDTAKAAARRALRHRDKNGSKCGTAVGWQRANQISSGEKLSLSTIKRTFSFLSRAETYNQGKFTDDDGKEICGSVMYAAWGGTSMRSWCSGIINKAEGRKQVGEVDGSPVFDTPDAALAHAESIGCSGYHEHDLEGKTVYMACSTHEDAQEDQRSEISGDVKKGLQKKVDDHNEKVSVSHKKTSLRTLTAVFKRGVGAYKTNPGSVRPNVKSPEQWAYARVNSFLYALKNEKFRSGKHDTDLFPSGHPLSSK